MAHAMAVSALLLLLGLAAHVYTGFLYRLLSGMPARAVMGIDQFLHAHFVPLLGVAGTAAGLSILAFGLAYLLHARAQQVRRPDPFRRIALSAHAGQKIPTDAPKVADRARFRSPGRR